MCSLFKNCRDFFIHNNIKTKLSGKNEYLKYKKYIIIKYKRSTLIFDLNQSLQLSQSPTKNIHVIIALKSGRSFIFNWVFDNF